MKRHLEEVDTSQKKPKNRREVAMRLIDLQFRSGTRVRGQRVFLTHDEKSIIDIFHLPKHFEMFGNDPRFEELWNMRPLERGAIHGKPLSRWSQAYGKDCIYSGKKLPAPPIFPDSLLGMFLAYANATPYFNETIINETTIHGQQPFNNIMMNWYENGHDSHDCQAEEDAQIDFKNGETIIMVISFGETRKYCFTPKHTGLHSSFTTEIPAHTCMVMAGTLQQTHFHSLPKQVEKTGRRISLTFRTFQ